MPFLKFAASAFAVVVVLLLGTASVGAHHSFAAAFDASQPMELRGTVTKFEWINPHAWVHVDVKKPDGQVENWQAELGPPNSLLRRGWTKNSVAPGTEIVLFGYRAKDPRMLRLNGQQVLLPDGRRLFSGDPDAGAPGSDSSKN
jgi:uncharacterized protein DUF6152